MRKLKKIPTLKKEENIENVFSNIQGILNGLMPYDDLLKIGFNLILFRMILPQQGSDKRTVFFYESLKKPEGLLFQHLLKGNIKQNINGLNIELERLNPEIFNGFLLSIKYNEYEMLTEPILKKILNELEKIKLWKVNKKLIYDLFLKTFTHSIYRYNRFLTMGHINELMAGFIDDKVSTIYDPAFGHGDSLVKAIEYQEKNYYNDSVKICGMELNTTIYIIGRIQFFLKGIFKSHLFNGDSFLHPRFLENNRLQKFDIVLSHLPHDTRLQNLPKELIEIYKNFKYGFPKNVSKEFLIFLHSIASLNETGKAILIIPERIPNNKTEASIIRTMINDDIIESILYLGGKHTMIASQLIIINKKKPKFKEGKIIFYDISRILTNIRIRKRQKKNFREDVDHIIRDCSKMEEGAELKIATLDEIRMKNFSLNVHDYLIKKEKIPSIKEIGKELIEIDKKIDLLKKKRETILKELMSDEK